MNSGEQTTMDTTLAKNMEEKMSTPQEKKPVAHLDKLVINAVISELGKPSNLIQVTAGKLWSDRWRVNVWCVHNIETEFSVVDSPRIDYSYFLRYDEESGKIISCDPEIKPIEEVKK
jgi:cell division FtsZ-interacting protein ZapD